MKSSVSKPQLVIFNHVVHKQTKEKPAARKSTFGFSHRISQRSKTKRAFTSPPPPKLTNLPFKQKNKNLH